MKNDDISDAAKIIVFFLGWLIGMALARELQGQQVRIAIGPEFSSARVANEAACVTYYSWPYSSSSDMSEGR
jgi:hypothetical protein